MNRQRTRLPRAYWRLFSASGVSNVGDGVLVAALPLLAARVTDSELSVGLVSAFFTGPWLLLSLPAGAIIDRSDPRRVMVATDTYRAVLVGSLAAVAAFADIRVWMLWLLALGLGIGEVFFDSASQAMVPAVVDTAALERANGWRYSAELVGNTFVGLPVGSILFAVAVWLPFGVDAATFVVAAILVASLPRRVRPPSSAPASTLRTDVGDGLRWLRRHPMLRDLAAALAVTNLAFALIESTLVLYLTREIGLDERLFGVVVAIMGAGGVVAGLVSGRVVEVLGRRWTVVLVSVLPVATMAALACARSAWVVVLLATAQAMLTTIWSVVAVSLRQQLVPDEYFGRVNGVYRWLSWGTMPLGAAIGGALAQTVGLRSPYVVGAWLLAAAAVFVIARVAPFVPDRAGAG